MTPNFSRLPDVAWVDIMSHLSLPDRGRLARTCRALEASFRHPSLWYTVTITLHGDTARGKRVGRTAASYVPMVERFGAYFQDLTLVFVDYEMRMTPDCEAVIACLSRCSRYERLTLDVRSLVRSRDIVGDFVPRTTDLDVLSRLVTDAYRLRWEHCIIVCSIETNVKNQSGISTLCAKLPFSFEKKTVHFRCSLLTDLY